MENQPSKNHPNRHIAAPASARALLCQVKALQLTGFKSQLPAAPGFAGAQEKPPAGRGQQTC